MAKQISYDEQARHKIMSGVNQLADTVKLTTVLEVLESPEFMINDEILGEVVS